MQTDLAELSGFLAGAKGAIYCGEGVDMGSEEGSKNICFVDGDWDYSRREYGRYLNREKSVADFVAEVVRFRREPVWAMSFQGGILPEFRDEIKFSYEAVSQINDWVYDLLIDSYTSAISQGCSHTGPPNNSISSVPKLSYVNFSEGSLEDFSSVEIISCGVYYRGAEHPSSGVPSGFTDGSKRVFKRRSRGVLL
ncbi:MAG: hypothetical protein Q8P81_00965 [Nanoarchaeota archaeon]|nr:hypothetical protein [Nanoarchaeota archaeon]